MGNGERFVNEVLRHVGTDVTFSASMWREPSSI